MTEPRSPEPPVVPDMLPYLRVDVHPASGATRWAWQLVDERDGAIVETELGFDSPVAASRAGYSRLAELAVTPQAAATATSMDRGEADHLVIVSPAEDALYEFLSRVFAGHSAVEVIRDRRRPAPPSRVLHERRAPRKTGAGSGGWWIACRPSCTALPRRRSA